MLALFVAALAFTLLAGAGGLAADEKTHDGMVVKAGDGKLIMTYKYGKNDQTHMVAREAKITCDGKECKLDDLQKGFSVKVTTEGKGDKTVVTKIDAKKKA